MKLLWLAVTTLATILGFVVMAILLGSIVVTLLTFGGYGIFWFPCAMILIALGSWLRTRDIRRKQRPQGHHP